MDRVEVRSDSRTIAGKQVKKLRAEGLVPAVMFGPDTVAVSIQVAERALAKALSQAGSALINLYIDGGTQPHAVLVRDVQRNTLTGRLQHVDFYEVRLTEKLRTTIPLLFTGQSPLIVAEDALLNRRLEEVEVECLPADLPEHIVIDISALQSMNDEIRVSDLIVPAGVTLVEDANAVVASLQSGRASMQEELPEVVQEIVPEEEEEEAEE